MSATLTRSSLDSYLNLNVQNVNSAVQNRHVSSDTDKGVDFAKALSILTSAAQRQNSAFKNGLSSDDSVLGSDESFLSEFSDSYNLSANDETEETSDNVKSSLEERFSVLDNSRKKEEWELLEKKPSQEDYSILSKLGDGLLTAAKFAAGAYLGKVI